jgi:hypothetical protein
MVFDRCIIVRVVCLDLATFVYGFREERQVCEKLGFDQVLYYLMKSTINIIEKREREKERKKMR